MSLPSRVTIELTNDCNRHCPECPRFKVPNMKIGYMKCSLFRKIIRQLPDETVVVPFFRGESTMHPNFYALMKELKRFKTVQLATNGDLLHRRRVRRAILSYCTFISLSLHEYMLPEDNKRFTDFLWDANEAGLNTQASIVDTNLDKSQQEFVNSWLEHADRVRIYRRHSIKSLGDVANIKLANSDGMPCRKPFTETTIYYNGRVALCNHDWSQSFQIGDLNTQTIMDAFNSSAYKWVRHWHTTKHRQNVPACRDCMMFAASYLPDGMFGKLYTEPIEES